jgi:hypothetical protein
MSTPTVLAVLTGILFVVTGGVKVVGLRQSLAIRDHFGMDPRLWRAIGVLETAGGVGVLAGTQVTGLGLAALVGLAALMVGAVASRLRVHDPVALVLGDVAVLVLVAATFVALANN